MLPTTAVLVALLSAAPTPPRVALLPLSAGDGVKPQTAESFTDALAAEIRKLNAVQLVTERELGAVVSLERQKQLLGCDTSSCMAELAGALDASELVTGSLSKLGESWLLQVQRVNATTGNTVGHASRRKKGGNIDDLLDDLPQVAQQLFSGMPAQRTEPAPKVAAPAKVEPAAAPPLDPPYRDVPTKGEVDRSKLVFLTDGKGHFVAVEPFNATEDERLFAGDEKALYAQRVFGGGRSGKERFDAVFWDPRAKARWQAGLEFRDGKYSLQCGDQKIELKRVPAAKEKRLRQSAKLHGVRWQRFGYALARDEDGNWFYVDQAREPADNTDFRVYLKGDGGWRVYQADVLAHDAGGDIFRAGGGRLKLQLREKKGEWIHGDGRTQLTVLPAEDNARLIYTSLGAYSGMPLGTPCDPHLGAQTK